MRIGRSGDEEQNHPIDSTRGWVVVDGDDVHIESNIIILVDDDRQTCHIRQYQLCVMLH